MSRWRPDQIALCGAVGLLVTSAHLAAGAWAMRQQIPALPAAPAAIEIDLAPAPPPPEPVAEAESLPPEPEPEVEQEPEPEPEPEPQPEPEPVPDFVPPPLIPLPPADFASLAPPPPKQRPERITELARRVEPEPQKPKPEKRVEKPKPEKPKAERPRAETRAAPTTERRQPQASGGAPRPSAGAMQSWQDTAGSRIARHMSRTRVAGAKGAVSATVQVTVQGNGAASGRLARGTGDPRIDAALSRQVARLPRLPAPPDGRAASFTLPISVVLR